MGEKRGGNDKGKKLPLAHDEQKVLFRQSVFLHIPKHIVMPPNTIHTYYLNTTFEYIQIGLLYTYISSFFHD